MKLIYFVVLAALASPGKQPKEVNKYFWLDYLNLNKTRSFDTLILSKNTRFSKDGRFIVYRKKKIFGGDTKHFICDKKLKKTLKDVNYNLDRYSSTFIENSIIFSYYSWQEDHLLIYSPKEQNLIKFQFQKSTLPIGQTENSCFYIQWLGKVSKASLNSEVIFSAKDGKVSVEKPNPDFKFDSSYFYQTAYYNGLFQLIYKSKSPDPAHYLNASILIFQNNSFVVEVNVNKDFDIDYWRSYFENGTLSFSPNPKSVYQFNGKSLVEIFKLPDIHAEDDIKEILIKDSVLFLNIYKDLYLDTLTKKFIITENKLRIKAAKHVPYNYIAILRPGSKELEYPVIIERR